MTIKTTLSSSDSWSIVRIGDYFVKTNKNKRRHNQQNDGKEKVFKSLSTKTDETNDEVEVMLVSDDNKSSCSSMEDFDMLDDIYGTQSLFRIMPQTTNNCSNDFQSIVEPG